MQIQKELGQISATTLADFILKHYGPMSHLKLQKLLFYCDGYHLGYFGEPLVFENFEAWVHGPVCVEVYHELKGHSVLYSDVSFNAGERNDPDEAIGALVSKQQELINDVLKTLSTWKDSELETATHREQPWLEARAGLSKSEKSNNIISKIAMRDFYKNEISYQA